jgi:hypothetical protein
VLHGGGPIRLVRATWKKGSGAQFFMGFGPTGPRRLGDLVFPTTRKRWVAVRASDGEAARVRLGAGESGLRCTSGGREGIYGGSKLWRSSRILQCGDGVEWV